MVVATTTGVGFGVTPMLVTGPTITETDAEPVTVPFDAETTPVPGTVWAVNRPPEVTEPTLVLQVKITPEMELLYAS